MTDTEALKPEDIQTVAIAGAGIMGSSIAQILAQKGCTVLVTGLRAVYLNFARS